MNQTEIAIVQSTWAEVKPIAGDAAKLFYRRLFELDPEIRHLFVRDPEDQGRRLMAMLDFAISRLDRVEMIVATLEQLGLRHVGYGVRDEHYDVVGAALLWTLEAGLGARFDREAKAAWSSAYQLLADTMRAGARPVAA